jgi:hypothetical protein
MPGPRGWRGEIGKHPLVIGGEGAGGSEIFCRAADWKVTTVNPYMTDKLIKSRGHKFVTVAPNSFRESSELNHIHVIQLDLGF